MPAIQSRWIEMYKLSGKGNRRLLADCPSHTLIYFGANRFSQSKIARMRLGGEYFTTCRLQPLTCTCGVRLSTSHVLLECHELKDDRVVLSQVLHNHGLSLTFVSCLNPPKDIWHTVLSLVVSMVAHHPCGKFL